MKDWTGNKRTAFAIIGASNHCKEDRVDNDYYATDPKALEMLLEHEEFNKQVWEPACGEWHLASVLKTRGYYVRTSDIVERSCPCEIIDFLKYDGSWCGDIITNPPYKISSGFVEKVLDIIPVGNRVAMFLKLTFLEGKKRREMFDRFPPKLIYVFSQRIKCARNGDFSNTDSSAVCYAWFIWEKGFNGSPIIKWL